MSISYNRPENSLINVHYTSINENLSSDGKFFVMVKIFIANAKAFL